jgi:segregation and condensation protein A
MGGMSDAFALDIATAEAAAEDGEGLIIELEGYEGPLHVLLALARKQKVDLLKLSILKLADQYLAFVHQARRRDFTLAADYLVMAAWLAYLKSRLLLPKPEAASDEPAAMDMAAALAFRLAQLDAMKQAVEALKSQPQLGRDVFVRGDPEAVKVIPSSRVEGDLYQLMAAYAGQAKRAAARHYRPPRPHAYAIDDARDRLKGLLAELKSWTPLAGIAPFRHGPGEGPSRASYLASTLSASLDLVKEGMLEARQLEAFTDVYVRARHRKEQAA